MLTFLLAAKVVVTFIWLGAGVGVSAYDPNNQYSNLADPAAAIKCIGPPSPVDYAIPLGHRRKDAFLQNLCAQSQYGGYPNNYNQGGYCGTRSSTGQRLVVFHHYPGSPASARVKAECQLRCVCTGDPADTTTLSPYNHIQHSTHAIAGQVVNLSSRKILPRRVEIIEAGKMAPYITIPIVGSLQQQEVESTLAPRHWADHVVLSKKNLIICSGNLPDFQLPYPARPEYFSSLQELCAVHLSGGNEKMNAGSFCHRSRNWLGRKVSDVLFADEMTPLNEWTWDNRDYFPNTPMSTSSIRLRMYCFDNCRCREEEETPGKRPWASVFKVGVIEKLKQQDGSSSQSSGMNSGHSSDSSLCSANSPSCYGGNVIRQFQLVSDFFPAAWKPLPGVSTTESQTCNAQCDGPGQCLSENSEACPYSGQCKVDPSSLRQRVGGTLATVVTTLAFYCTIPSVQHPSRLGGRGTSRDDEWPCACNTTYVSHACCQVLDGAVWEEPHLQLL